VIGTLGSWDSIDCGGTGAERVGTRETAIVLEGIQRRTETRRGRASTGAVVREHGAGERDRVQRCTQALIDAIVSEQAVPEHDGTPTRVL
jgi:hypothetical protein